MPLLCRTPQPQLTESLFGFVLRVSEANGYDTPHHIWKSAGIPRGSECAPRFPTEPLAAVLGLKRGTLHPLAYRSDLKGRGSFKILGHPLGDAVRGAPLRLKHPAFCPRCVSETGYLDAFWDLSAAVACPVHGSAVLTVCPTCRTRIRWDRPGLLTCQCGGSFRDAPTRVSSPVIVDLMTLLQSRLHGQTGSIQNPGGLPLEHLVGMPFSALLHLVAVLGEVAASVKARNVHGQRMPATQRFSVIWGNSPSRSYAPGYSPTAVVAAAAQALSNWPHGYHSFLRKLGNHNLASGRKAAGMRRQFAEFYETLFKNRPAMRGHCAFLREEFIVFGLQWWGKGVIDPRMLRDKDASKPVRFMSKSGFAKRHRLWGPTVLRMAQSGAFSGIKVKMTGAERAIVDARNTSLPAAVKAVINVRSAAKQLGLTVRVLERLRAQKIYAAAECRRCAGTWLIDEIDAFRARLLALAPIASAGRQPGTVTLNEVARRSTLPAETRVAVITAFLNRSLRSVGRSGSNPGSILLNRKEIEATIERHLKPLLGSTCSLEECSEKTGMCRAAVAPAIKAGHLVQTVVRGRKRVTVASVKRFASAYLPLAALGKKNLRSPRLLIKLARQRHLPVIFVARTNHTSPQGFIRRSREPQLLAALAEYAAEEAARPARGDNLVAYEARLRMYCTQRIEGGQGLPRRGGIPIKRAIALACNFNRDVFYDRPRMKQLLEEFDNKERNLNKGTHFMPIEAVRDYLSELKRLRAPLPLWQGHPNVVRIASQCRIDRHVIQRNPQIMRLLKQFALQHDLNVALQNSLRAARAAPTPFS